MADLFRVIGDSVNSIITSIPALLPRVKEVEKIVVKEIIPMNKFPAGSRMFVRIAGVSGALAVALGAYGSHVLPRKEEGDDKLREVFEIASKYHFIHTLALLFVPFTRKPLLTGTLLTVGLTLFCGSCYYHALTSSTNFRKVTPYGGFLLIFAWASMAL